MIEPGSALPPKRIAIVVPLFKHSALVFDAMESVLAQDGAIPFDVVIVDDGCPHEQSVVAGVGLANIHDNIYYLRHANRGLSGARNRGIDFVLAFLPDCDAVFFLDADNYVLPFALNSFRRALDNHPEFDWFYPDIVYTGVEEYDGDYSGAYSLALHTTMNTCEAGSLVRRRVFEAGVRFDEDMKLGFEDWEFWLSAAEAGFKGLHLPESGFRYRKRPESMIKNSERSGPAIRGYIESKHLWMRDPTAMVTLEHLEAPRYAIILVDRQMVRLTSDPCEMGEELSIRDYETRFWASLMRPNAHNVGAFAVITTESAMRWLDSLRLTRWVFWDIEARLANSNFTSVDIALHADDAISTSVVMGDGRRDAVMAAISIKRARDICTDKEDTWLRGLLTTTANYGVNMRSILVPPAHQSKSIDRQMIDALVGLCLRLRTHPVDRTYGAYAAGRTLGTPDRSQIPQRLRNTFDNDILAPIIQKREGRVAFVLPLFEFGGVEKVALFVARAMKKRGYSPSLVLLKSQQIRLLDEFGSVFDEIHIIDSPGFGEWTGPDYQGTNLSRWSVKGDHSKMENLLSTFEVVINCHASDILGAMAVLRQNGVITASHLHLFDRSARGHRVGHPMLSVAFEHTLDLFIGCSQNVCAQLAALGVPEEKIVKVMNSAGCDIDPDHARSILERRLVREGPLRVLFLGRFDKQKGIDRLAAVFSHFRGKPDVVTIRVVGKAIIDSNLDGEIDAIRPFIEPAVYRASELAALYEWADVVLLPSRFEGLPLTLIEAMSYGAVPVVTNAGAIGEIVENNVNGLIVAQDNATPDLISAISGLAADRNRVRHLSRNAFDFAQSLDWDTAVEDLVQAIEKLRKPRRARRAKWLGALSAYAGRQPGPAATAALRQLEN